MFLIESEGTKIGELYSADSDGAKQIIIAAIEAGMTVTFQKRADAVPRLPAPTEGYARNYVSTPTKREAWSKYPALKAEAPKSGPKITAEPPEGSDFKPDDRVYLNWDAMAESLKLNFSGKRWSWGIVEQFRSGAGIRATVGVRFDGDKVVSWWQPKDLTTTQQVEA